MSVAMSKGAFVTVEFRRRSRAVAEAAKRRANPAAKRGRAAMIRFAGVMLAALALAAAAEGQTVTVKLSLIHI